MSTSVDFKSRLRPSKSFGKRLVAGASASDVLDSVADEIRHADFNRLSEAVSQLKRTPRAASGYPSVRPSDCRSVIEGLREYLKEHGPQFSHGDPVLPQRFFDLLDSFGQSDLRSYANEVAQLELVRVEALLLAGRSQEALALIGPRAERPYLVEDDFTVLERIFELDTLARLANGRQDEVLDVVLGRALFLARQRRRPPSKLFERFLPALALGPTFRREYSWLDFVPRLCARALMALRMRERHRRRIARLPLLIVDLCLVALGAVSLQLLAFPRRRLRLQVGGQNLAIDPRDVLVTRAMGGVGDIVMMTPGLRALAKRIGRPVCFATKRQFLPLLENLPEIRALDVDEVIPVHRFDRWVNLSFCPASRYESRATPNIRRGRVELFAGAMGVRPVGRDQQPACALSAEQQRLRDFHRSRFAANGMPVIGVQPFSRENYRSYAGLFEALAPFLERARIVYFHTSPLPVPLHDNLVQIHGLPLRQTLAAIAACDYFVSVDSAFFHVAAAFDLPTLGIFGPTSGKVRASHHPRALILEAPEGFHCSPCWRTEDQVCQVTRSLTSACLASLPPQRVGEEIERLMREHPLAVRH
jgi:ADP-heptose:LPS heptosyltransferase